MTADERLKVALDGTPLVGRPTGVAAFCAGLLGELARRPDLEVGAFAISRRGRAALEGRLPAGARALGPPGPGLPARALHAAWARGPFPPAELWSGRAQVVHGTNFVVPPAWRAATVVTVHDLTPLHHPEWCLPAARAYPELVRKSVGRGAWVHADSEFVAEEVRSLLGVPAERVRAIYPGVPPRPEPARGTARDLLPPWVGSYVLGLGTVEPRKGFPILVEAFGRVAPHHPGLALVIAGAEGWASQDLAQALSRCPDPGRVVRLGWVDGAQRDALLEEATVFAYPSLYEGFGIPPLEAMAAGTPVIASDAGALPEVLGEAARLVPAGDEEALAGALGQLLEDQRARERLAAKGHELVARYSWDRCATDMVALYREAARGA